MGSTQDLNHLIERRIEDWKQRLVDLSRRNRLLYYKPSRTATLRFEEPSLSETFTKFAVQEHSWRFWCPPPTEPAARIRDFPEINVSLARGGAELSCHIADPTELVKVLKNLYRRARTDFEERGVRILHLAFGMLNWTDTLYGEKTRSPLILVPAELSRESARHPFQLNPTDEELVLNPALDVKLRNDFNVELPQLPDDWESTDLVAYLTQVSEYVVRQGWSVSHECALGLFSFHKLVIHRDLHQNSERVKAHRLIRTIAGEPNDEWEDATGPPDPTELEEALDPRDSFLVVDADSSQLASIEAVKQGCDLVLHGPPGTGKSQTITNVIAEFIARGRTVLFVSEKMAALEVVYKRLQDRQLGHFCLELHSHRANKRLVAQELDRCLREDLVPQSGPTSEEWERLLRRRQQLREYVNALHVRRQPIERTVRSVLGELAGLHDFRVFAFDFHPDIPVSPSYLARADEVSKALQTVWHIALEREAFPWRGCIEQRYNEAVRLDYERLLDEFAASITDLNEASGVASTLVGLSSPGSMDCCEWLARLLSLLENPIIPERSWFTNDNLDKVVEEAKGTQALWREYSLVRDRLVTKHGESFLQLPLSVWEEIASAHAQLAELVAAHSSQYDSLLTESLAIAQWADKLCTSLTEWMESAKNIIKEFKLNGTESDLTTARIGQLARLVKLCDEQAKPDWKLSTRLRQSSFGISVA